MPEFTVTVGRDAKLRIRRAGKPIISTLDTPNEFENNRLIEKSPVSPTFGFSETNVPKNRKSQFSTLTQSL